MGAAPHTPREGHVSAEELFRQHAAFVARFLFRLGVRHDAIEDAVQEVFLVVHRQGGYRPGAARPTSYLANLAVHAASAHRRRERVRGAREVDAPVDDVASTRSDPVAVLEANESLRRLQRALDRLEPDLRTVLVLVEIEGESCASIAAAMGIPAGTIYWRLHHARKKFERALQAAEAELRPQRAVAVQTAGLGPPPERNQRAGMMILLMTSPSWLNSGARELLRLGAARPPVQYAVEEGLARHLQIAATGAPVPSWAGRLGAPAKAAAWFAASAAVAVVGAAVVLVARPGGHSVPASPPAEAASRSSARATAASPWVPLAPTGSPVAGPTISVEALPAAAPPRALAERAAAPAALPQAAGAAPGDDDLLELEQVGRAERMLASDPAGALALVASAGQRFPRGYLKEERGYVEVLALLALRRPDEARPKVAAFLRDYPESAYARRVRDASRRAHLDP